MNPLDFAISAIGVIVVLLAALLTGHPPTVPCLVAALAVLVAVATASVAPVPKVHRFAGLAFRERMPRWAAWATVIGLGGAFLLWCAALAMALGWLGVA